MDQFRKFLLNPNVHGILAIIAQITASIPSPWAPVVQGIAYALMGTTVLLPESGSLHQEDYAKIADVIAKAIRPPVETTQGRT